MVARRDGGLKDKVRRLLETIRKRKGQGLVEYALLASLIALTAVFALGEMGRQVISFLTQFAVKLTEINMGK